MYQSTIVKNRAEKEEEEEKDNFRDYDYVRLNVRYLEPVALMVGEFSISFRAARLSLAGVLGDKQTGNCFG